MYIPTDLVNLIFSFLSFCNNCNKSIITEDYYFDDDKNFICINCKIQFKICQECKNLFECSMYCRFCMGLCKYLCKNCIPK